MLDDEVCAHGDHLAPATGGTCPCGMVTRVPAPAGDRDSRLRDLLVRCLVEPGGVADLPDLRRRADRLLGALAEAGLAVTPRPATGSASRRLSA